MIHLDTSFVIMSLVPGTTQDAQLRDWLAAVETVGVDAIVWSEFLCGPLTPQQRVSAETLFQDIQPFVARDAALAAELPNGGGRRRGSLTDCMIASIWIRQDVPLATANVANFQPFVAAGLKILSVA
jgi:predicted nucleic acid-binding protein